MRVGVTEYPNNVNRELQLTLLDMLSDLDEVLTNSGVDYFVSGGCVIGAVRHGGFIPWDDDVDVNIFKKDVPKFEKAIKALDPNKYIIVPPMTGTYGEGFYNISRIGTTHIINDKNPREQRISLEIFPMSDVPDGKMALAMYHGIMHVSETISNLTTCSIPEPICKMLVKCMKVLYRLMDIVCERSSGSRVESREGCYLRTLHAREVYGKPKRLQFEGRSFCFPENIDTYLTEEYGEYMTLPPEEERVPRSYSALLTHVDYLDYMKSVR